MKHLIKFCRDTKKAFCSWIMSAALIISPSLEAASKKQSSIDQQKALLKRHLNIFRPIPAKNKNAIKYKEMLPALNKILPAHQRRSLAFLSQLDPDATIPSAELKTVKGPDGQDILRILFTPPNPKDSFTVDLVGKHKTVMKVNGISLSYSDLYYPERAKKKLIKLSYFKKEALRTRNKILSASIVPSPEVMAKMTVKQKAEYFIKLRRMVEAATKVQDLFTKKNRKTSRLDNHLRPIDSFSRILINSAWAVEAGGTGLTCVNAGWLTQTNNSSRYCDHQNTSNTSPNIHFKEIFEELKTRCLNDNVRGDWIPCNPMIYGGRRDLYNKSEFKPICVPAIPHSDVSKKASVEGGTCENGSLLKNKFDQSEQIRTMIAFMNEKKNTNSCSPLKLFNYKKEDVTVKDEAVNKDCIQIAISTFQTYKDSIIKYCEDSELVNQASNIDSFQYHACEALEKRVLALSLAATNPEKPKPPVKPDVSVTPDSKPVEPENETEDCKFWDFNQQNASIWCSIGEGLLIGGLLAAGAGLICWAAGCFSDDEKKVQPPMPIPPVPPKGKLPPIPPAPTPPVTNDPPAAGDTPPPDPDPDPEPMPPPPAEGNGPTDTTPGDGVRRFKATK